MNLIVSKKTVVFDKVGGNKIDTLNPGDKVRPTGKADGDNIELKLQDGTVVWGGPKANFVPEESDDRENVDSGLYIEDCVMVERAFNDHAEIPPWLVSADFLVARALIETDLQNVAAKDGTDGVGPLLVTPAEWQSFLSNGPAELSANFSPDGFDHYLKQIRGAAWTMHADGKAISDFKASATATPPATSAGEASASSKGPFVPSNLDLFHAHLTKSPKAAIAILDAAGNQDKDKKISDVLNGILSPEAMAALFRTRAKFAGTPDRPKSVAEFIAATQAELGEALAKAFKLIEDHMSSPKSPPQLAVTGHWPKDSQEALIAFYGDPGKGECEAQLVPVVPPFRMTFEGQAIASIKFHKKAADALLAALNEIWEKYGKDQSQVDAAGVSRYDGAYNRRMIRGSATKWSNHAYGAAIDINARDNGFNTGHGTMPQIVVDAFKRQGARWGGNYRLRTDPMHFEFCDAGGAAETPIQPPTGRITEPIGNVPAMVGAGPGPGEYVFDAKRIAFLFNSWRDMNIVRARPEMEANARKMITHKDMYLQASAATGVPWWMIAVIDMREGGIERLGTRHLHNGDPLTGFTIQVPANHPKVGHGPPFTWLESAIDALKLEGLDTVKNWTIERVLHKLEPYNGLSYYRHNRPSPYIWSCTTIYDPPTGPGGKVLVDHGPIENVVDKQNGCAPQLLIMSQIDTSIVFTHESPPLTS